MTSEVTIGNGKTEAGARVSRPHSVLRCFGTEPAVDRDRGCQRAFGDCGVVDGAGGVLCAAGCLCSGLVCAEDKDAMKRNEIARDRMDFTSVARFSFIATIQ